MKQFIYLILFASLFEISITRSSAYAKTFYGTLEKSKSAIYLLQNNTKIELQCSDPELKSTLLKLKTKDYISVDGTLVEESTHSRKSSLYSVQRTELKFQTPYYFESQGSALQI